jgi:hypothetical protein
VRGGNASAKLISSTGLTRVIVTDEGVRIRAQSQDLLGYFHAPAGARRNPWARTWYAILEMAGDDGPPEVDTSDRIGHGIRYSFSAQAFTNTRMDARLPQNSLQPGASITISATLTEYGIPVAPRANVRAERELPDKTRATLALSEADSGRFRSARPQSFQEPTESVWWVLASRRGASCSHAINRSRDGRYGRRQPAADELPPLRKGTTKTCASCWSACFTRIRSVISSDSTKSILRPCCAASRPGARPCSPILPKGGSRSVKVRLTSPIV